MFSKLWFVGLLFIACIEGYGYGGGGGRHSIGEPVVVKVGAPGFSLSGSIKEDPADKEAEYDGYHSGAADIGFGFTDELGKLLDKFKGGLKIEKNPDGTPSIKLEGSLNLPARHHNPHDDFGPYGHHPHHGYHGHHRHHPPYGHHPPYDHHPPYGYHGDYDHYPPYGHHGHHPSGMFPGSPFGSLFGFPLPFLPHGPHPHGDIEDDINEKPSSGHHDKPTSSPHDCKGKCPPEIEPHHHEENQENAVPSKQPYRPNYDADQPKPQRPPHSKNPGRRPGKQPGEKPQSNHGLPSQNVPYAENPQLCDSFSGNSGANGCDLETKPNGPIDSEGSEQFSLENGSLLDSIPNPLGVLGNLEPKPIDKHSKEKPGSLYSQEPNHHEPEKSTDHISPTDSLEHHEEPGNPSKYPAPHVGKYPHLPHSDYTPPDRAHTVGLNPLKNPDREVSSVRNPCIDNPTKCSPNFENIKPPHKSGHSINPSDSIDSLDSQHELNPSRPQNPKPGEYPENQPGIEIPSDDNVDPNNYENDRDSINDSQQPYIPASAQMPIKSQTQHEYPHNINNNPHNFSQQPYMKQPEYPTIPTPEVGKPSELYPAPEVPKHNNQHKPESLPHEHDDQVYYPEEQPAMKPSYKPTTPRTHRFPPHQNPNVNSGGSYPDQSGNIPKDELASDFGYPYSDTIDSTTDKPSEPYHLPLPYKPYHENTPNRKPAPHNGGYQLNPDQNNLAPPKRSYSPNSNPGKQPHQPENGRPNTGFDNVIPKGTRTSVKPPTLPFLDQIEDEISDEIPDSTTKKSLAQLAKEICGPHCWVPSQPDPKPEEIGEDYGENLEYTDDGTEYDDSEPIENGEYGGLVVDSTTRKLELSPKAAPEKKPLSPVESFPAKLEPLKPKNPSISTPSNEYDPKEGDHLQNPKIPLKSASPNGGRPANQNNRGSQERNRNPAQFKPQKPQVGYAPNNQDDFPSRKREETPQPGSGPFEPDSNNEQGPSTSTGDSSNRNIGCGLACSKTPGQQTVSSPGSFKEKPNRNNVFKPKPSIPVEPQDFGFGAQESSTTPYASGSEVGGPVNCGESCNKPSVFESSSTPAPAIQDENNSSEVYDDADESNDAENNSENNDGGNNDDENNATKNNTNENTGGENTGSENNNSKENLDIEEQPMTPASESSQSELPPQQPLKPPIDVMPQQSNPAPIVPSQAPECGSQCESGNQQPSLPSAASPPIPHEMMSKLVTEMNRPTPPLDSDQPKKPQPCHGHRRGHHRRCHDGHRIRGHVPRHHGYRR